MKLYVDTSQVRIVMGAAIGLAVVSLGIGALILLAKSKKHSVGLEGITGKKAVDSDALTVKN